MLSKDEIERLTNKYKKDVNMSNPAMLSEVANWDFSRRKFRPQLIVHIYLWMKTHYVQGNTLEDMERGIGIGSDRLSHILKLLEYNGYLAIARHTKPFLYRVIK